MSEKTPDVVVAQRSELVTFLDGLSAEQRFFLSFAQIWRARSREENERLQLRTDGHSPPRFRVAGVIANLPEFSSAYSCSAGKPLLSESDRANIW